MTSQPTDANDILMGGGGKPTASFPEPGAAWGGYIVDGPTAFQEREYDKATGRSDGPLKTFPSGDPIMALHIDIQTDVRDPSIEDDDGIRRIYIQGKELKNVFREGIRKAGSKGLKRGDWVGLQFTHRDDPMDKRSLKHWALNYVPAAAPANDVLNQGAPQAPSQPAPQPPAQPAPAPAVAQPAPTPPPAATAPAPAPAQPVPATPAPQPAPAAPAAQAQPQQSPVDKAKTILAAGGDVATAAQFSGLDPAVVAAIQAQLG